LKERIRGKYALAKRGVDRNVAVLFGKPTFGELLHVISLSIYTGSSINGGATKKISI
jgi:hypothetical protein